MADKHNITRAIKRHARARRRFVQSLKCEHKVGSAGDIEDGRLAGAEEDAVSELCDCIPSTLAEVRAMARHLLAETDIEIWDEDRIRDLLISLINIPMSVGETTA